jgi:hypothetical protein
MAKMRPDHIENCESCIKLIVSHYPNSTLEENTVFRQHLSSPYAHGYFYSVVFYMQKPCQTRIMKAVSSQEIIARPPPIRWQMPLVIRHGREDAKLGAEVSVDGHDGCYVAASVAVVGCGPYGYYRALWEMILVPFIDKLMRTSNQLQAIDVIEFAGDLVSEQPAGAARANSPRFHVLRVGPDEVAESALVGNLLGPGHHANLVDGAYLRAEAAVDA